MRERHLVLTAIALVASACTDAGPSEPDPTLGVVAEVYLNEALDVMEFNSINRLEIDWPAFRDFTLREAAKAGAENPTETHPSIVSALERLGDNHSFFLAAGTGPATPSYSVHQATPQAVASRSGQGERGFAAAPQRATGGSAQVSGGSAQVSGSAQDPTARLLTTDVSYLDIPAFAGGGADGDAMSATYHDLIASVDAVGPTCRWVVDLRGNSGGNMWPMLAGVGPILGDGTAGFFLYPDEVMSPWFYENGLSGLDERVIARAEAPHVREESLPWVAVLTDSLTASAGEAVVVAFRGRERARSFGEATWGVSTGNAAFPLADGSVIFLTVATMVDRAGTVYGGVLEPDQPVPNGVKTGQPESDLALAAALEWLEAQSCS